MKGLKVGSFECRFRLHETTREFRRRYFGKASSRILSKSESDFSCWQRWLKCSWMPDDEEIFGNPTTPVKSTDTAYSNPIERKNRNEDERGVLLHSCGSVFVSARMLEVLA